MEKKINSLMVVMSGIGGFIGFIVAEVILRLYENSLPHTVLMGLYFGVLAFFIAIMCLVAEIISPKLNGYNWKNNYKKTSLKFLIPCSLIGVFIVGLVSQFIYELNIGNTKKINDIVLLIDTSESMKDTDPKNERFEAVKNLLQNMKADNRVSIYQFNDNVSNIQPMVQITDEVRQGVAEKLKKYEKPMGKTNIKGALEEALKEIDNTSNEDRHAMLILLSDGEDNFNLEVSFDESMQPYKDKRISINTIGMSEQNHLEMLKKISKSTGGEYHNVKDNKDLKEVFNGIYNLREQRLLTDKRNGEAEHNKIYAFLRVLLITIIGIAISSGVSFIFDNKYLLKGYIIGGILSGILAGLILEFGFSNAAWFGTIYRFLADIILAVVFTLIPVSVQIREDYRNSFRENGGQKYNRNRRVENNNSF